MQTKFGTKMGLHIQASFFQIPVRTGHSWAAIVSPGSTPSNPLLPQTPGVGGTASVLNQSVNLRAVGSHQPPAGVLTFRGDSWSLW